MDNRAECSQGKEGRIGVSELAPKRDESAAMIEKWFCCALLEITEDTFGGRTYPGRR
jgi:hypothetical protein